MAEATARVYKSLSPEEQTRTAIFANSYGQAGAIDFFGPRLGVPKSICNHQSYWLWGPRDFDGSIVVVLGSDGTGDREHFQSVEAAGSVEHPYSRRDKHFDIFLCRGLTGDLHRFWPAHEKLPLMKRSTSWFVIVLVLLLVIARAQPPPSLQDPFLDNFVGDWKVERKMRKEVQQTSVHCEWVLRHHFIQFHYGSPAGTDYEAFVFIGFDGAAKKYVCHWVDVLGASYSALGYGQLDSNLFALEFRFEPKDGELTNKFTFDPKTKTWTSLIRQVEKGEWVTFAEEKWTKQ